MRDGNAAGAAQVRTLFDTKATTWSAKYEVGGPLTDRLALMATAVQQHTAQAASVLDLGCATGDLAGELRSRGFAVTASDISREMLQEAERAHSSAGISWVQLETNWRVLPFPVSSFDTVLASSVLEYVDDPATVLQECARVLKPGGFLICSIPDMRHPIRWGELLVSRVALAPGVRPASRRYRRLNSYLTYLRVSRQRHSLRWWRTTAAIAGILPIDSYRDRIVPTPLRMLRFQKARGIEV